MKDTLRECQRLPPGDWSRWVFRTGRGAGKNYAGAHATNAVGREPRSKLGVCAIVGHSYQNAVDYMVMGKSGILATADPATKPTWIPQLRTLVWPNGLVGYVFGADQHHRLREVRPGRPWSFSWVWADEPEAWADFGGTWAIIEPQITAPPARAMLTLTHINGATETMESQPGTVVTTSSTFDNTSTCPRFMAFLGDRYDSDPRVTGGRS